MAVGGSLLGDGIDLRCPGCTWRERDRQPGPYFLLGYKISKYDI